MGPNAVRRRMLALLALAACCLLVGGVASYGAAVVLDEGAFATRAAGTLAEDEVREELAHRVALRLAAERPELRRAEPLVAAVVAEDVAGGPDYREAFRGAAARMHRALFRDPDAPVALAVPGTVAALRAAAEPRLGRLPALEDPTLLTVGSSPLEAALRRLAPVARTVAGLAPLILLAGVALLVLAALRCRDRRRALWAAALAVAAAGGAGVAATMAAGEILLEGYDTGFGDAVVRTVWNAYMADLQAEALGVTGVALVVAAVAGGPRPAARRLLSRPGRPALRRLRAAAMLTYAAVAVALPDLALHLAMFALAGALAYVAAGDLTRRQYRTDAR